MPFVTAPEDPHPASGLRERKKRAARAAVVDAALELFADRGFEHTTIADVAERAGVSPATVARYFDSKESLLFSERDERLPALTRAIAARPSAEGPYRAVRGALHEQPWAEGDTDARLLRSRLAIARSPTLRGRADLLLAGWRDAVADGLAARGVPADRARVTGLVATALLDDAVDRWALDGGRTDLLAVIDEAFAVLERSWGAADATTTPDHTHPRHPTEEPR